MSTVHVKGLSGQSEKEIKDFFSFCGKISTLSITPEDSSGASQSAAVTFEKESAARTALLLDGTQLGKSTVSVSSASSLSDLSAGHEEPHHDGDEIAQELKPRSRILAEYLASGYKLGDAALSRGLELDNKHQVSSKFSSYLQTLDSKTNATGRVQKADQKLGMTQGLNQAWMGLGSYFQAAAATDTGRKLHSFYTTQASSVLDIHAEALRLSGLRDKYNQTTGTGTGSSSSSEGKFQPESVGNGKTHCGCGGVDGVCGCASGNCTCAGCSKAGSDQQSSTATGNSDKVASDSKIAPLGEKN